MFKIQNANSLLKKLTYIAYRCYSSDRNISFAIFFAVFIFSFFSSVALADSVDVSNLIIPQQQKFLESEMLSKDLEEFDDWRAKEEKQDKEGEEKSKIADGDSNTNKPCSTINFIEFDGNTVFSKNQLQAILYFLKTSCRI